MNVLTRIVATLATLAAYLFVNAVTDPIAFVASGELAGKQLENSDTAYVTTTYGLQFLQSLHIPILAVVVILVAVWWKYLKQGLAAFFTVIVFCLLLTPPPAKAYYDTTEKTEAYTILPNQSAFWVPDTGDNKTSQVKFNSEEYWTANKIAAKRFVIPHHKLGNSGGFLGVDAYVPDGRLYIVDRTPFSREWVDAQDRGTGAKKEGFPCQSSEGLNTTVGVSIGASVTEENAAKYLAAFGVVSPKGDPTDRAVIFTSVYYGRPFADVMDDVARKQVQTLVCRELSARTLDDGAKQANAIMDKVREETKTYLANVGITLQFLGWADTFTYDPSVQKAINDRYIAATLAPVASTLQALAQIQVAEGAGKGLADKGLPIVVNPDTLKNLMGMFQGQAGAAPKAPASTGH